MRKLLACISLAALVTGLTWAWPAHAQKHDLSATLIGDGAAACAAAKTAAFARAPRAAASAASANYDVTFYHIDLSVPMDTDSIAGVVRVDGTVVDSPLQTLVLDLASNMVVTSVELPDDTPLEFFRSGDVLTISLPAAFPVGWRVAVDIAYHGTPFVADFGNFVFGTRNGDRYAWSLSEPYGAREWWPCKDHPSDKADSLRVTVTVPSAYRVGSQGVLVSETSGGGVTTYDWVSRYPISTYLVSLAIGEYIRYQGVYDRPDSLVATYGPLSLPLEHYVYNDENHALPTGWANVVDAFPLLERWFGAYPFATEKYGHAEFTFGGGMEHQTLSSMGTSAISVVTHELAHQWYGDSISPKRWKHLWLNEGFATYSELLYWEARAVEYPGTYEAVLDARFRFAREATGTLVLQDTTDVNDMFDPSRVYAKGSMVLWMLRYVVGDADFGDILRAYAADPAVRFGNAVTADFQRVAEAVSGRDLDAFFRQWVTEGTGFPTYASSSAWQNNGAGYRVWVTVSQVQDAAQSNVDVFEMPLVIEVTTAAGTERVRVDNDRRAQVFEFDVAAKPLSVRVDPDRRILRANDIVTSVQPVPSFPAIANLAPNPAAGSFDLHYLVDQAGDVTIDVYDVAGRRVRSETVPGVETGLRIETIDVSRMPSGVYFLRVSTRQGQAARKFVVLR